MVVYTRVHQQHSDVFCVGSPFLTCMDDECIRIQISAGSTARARMAGFRSACVAALAVGVGALAIEAKPTSVILFVVDDLGWGDLAFSDLPYDRKAGGHAEYSTPNIDRLAREGVVLDNYYVRSLAFCVRGGIVTFAHGSELSVRV